MKILVIDNLFTGAYGSLNYFTQEIYDALRAMHYSVFRASSVEEAISIYETCAIDFSIGVGKYVLEKDEMPLYDYYQVLHFQWVIDNPTKLNHSTKSEWVQYIYIDRLFTECIGEEKRRGIFLPIGVPEKFLGDCKTGQKKGIVFAGQVRDINQIYSDITRHRAKKLIKSAIERMISHLDEPFITLALDEVTALKQEDKNEVMLLCNSFIRAYKRELVICSISEYPIVFIGDNQSSRINNMKNVELLGKRDYYETFNIVKDYAFVLNIEPNFNNGFHDRVLRGLAGGSTVVTNYGKIHLDFFGDDLVLYKYTDIGNLEGMIAGSSEADLALKSSRARELIKKYCGWKHILQFIVNEYRENGKNDGDRLYRVLGN